MDIFLDKVVQNSKVAIFGTTIIAKGLLDTLEKERPDIKVLYFIDSFKKGKFFDVEIISPDESALKNDIDFFIIASVEHGKKLTEILKSKGIFNIIELCETELNTIYKNIVFEEGRTFSENSVKERYISGHYYSAVPSAEDFEEFLKNKNNDNLEFPGINPNLSQQLKNLEYIESIVSDIKFPLAKENNSLYYTDNIWFYPYDAYVLAGFMLKNKPSRIIEIGSGFSTAVMLDINSSYFDNKIEITCIEPNPERLKNVVQDKISSLNFIEKKLQSVDISTFSQLKENDILFVDSSHVAKMNSDVLKIFFEILPVLNSGVIIHFHDIFNDFSYPESWIKQHRCWNEVFFLRAFLQYNNAFDIEFYSDFIRAYAKTNNLKLKLPTDNGSGSFYIRRK